MLVHVSAGSCPWLTLWNCWPSTYHRSWLGLTERSHSKRYVWNDDWHVVFGQARLVPMPLVSLQGPPGLTPQCRTPHTALIPLTFSMMSNSPIDGQFQ